MTTDSINETNYGLSQGIVMWLERKEVNTKFISKPSTSNIVIEKKKGKENGKVLNCDRPYQVVMIYSNGERSLLSNG